MQIIIVVIGINMYFLNNLSALDSKRLIPENVARNNGRRDMDFWKIFVLGMLRLNCNMDFDKLHEFANDHRNLRLMLDHGKFNWDYYYALQTIKDNVWRPL